MRCDLRVESQKKPQFMKYVDNIDNSRRSLCPATKIRISLFHDNLKLCGRTVRLENCYHLKKIT